MSGTLMPAVLVRETGGPGDWNELVFEYAPLPVLRPGEVLVQVEACSVNRADLLQRRGLYPPPAGSSPLLGLDFAGFVIQTSPEAKEWSYGDRVFGVTAGGGYGRYVAVATEHLVSIPENLSFVEAAAAAEVFVVAFLNLFLEADLKAGETLLVHGGGSGVGTAAIQLARQAGARVAITAGSGDRVDKCLKLGADHGINYKEGDFAARVEEVLEGAGVDVILDWIGAPYLNRHLELLNARGRLVIIGLMGGPRGEIELAGLLTKRIRVIGSVLRSRSREEKAAIMEAFRRRVLPLLKSGEVRPIVDSIFPVAEAEKAHQHMRDGLHFGKIVLTWKSPRHHDGSLDEDASGPRIVPG